MEVIKANPEVFTYIAFPDVQTGEDLLTRFCNPISATPSACLFMVIDKKASEGRGRRDPQGRGEYAGILLLTATDPVNAVTEMGILIFPAFQRSHVTANAIGLLLCYTLDPPSAGGLGLRRVEWKCHAGHEKSRKTALKMGFEFEGVARWARVWEGAQGLPVEELERRNGTTGEIPGRHTASYSIVWDEWDAKRPLVIEQMQRKC